MSEDEQSEEETIQEFFMRMVATSTLVVEEDGLTRRIPTPATEQLSHPDVEPMDPDESEHDIERYAWGVFGRFRPEPDRRIFLAFDPDREVSDEVIRQVMFTLSHEYLHHVLNEMVGYEACAGLDDYIVENEEFVTPYDVPDDPSVDEIDVTIEVGEE